MVSISGSPPHGRGTRDARTRTWGPRRLTPARAGNTIHDGVVLAGYRAHPRTGGEHRSDAEHRRRQRGSPPHGRGTLGWGRHLGPDGGLTPARAGNTASSPTCRPSRSAHPRTGGEHKWMVRMRRPVPGSPPHGRGTLGGAVAGGRDAGLTPARAGNTDGPAALSPCWAAHPRTGGEHQPVGRRGSGGMGSPPHGRGTRVAHGAHPQLQGLTPARAGNTTRPRRPPWHRWAHPRTGGEHRQQRSDGTAAEGSPPHGRGTRAHARPGRPAARLTPARAGNTQGRASWAGRARAHPRTGGEHKVGALDVGPTEGSPPHGRGTRHGLLSELPQTGLTPARAGNTSQASTTWCGDRAHPRTGGEHSSTGAARALTLGSPPHGRGTHRRGQAHPEPVGLTPARAGNTPRASTT